MSKHMLELIFYLHIIITACSPVHCALNEDHPQCQKALELVEQAENMVDGPYEVDKADKLFKQAEKLCPAMFDEIRNRRFDYLLDAFKRYKHFWVYTKLTEKPWIEKDEYRKAVEKAALEYHSENPGYSGENILHTLYSAWGEEEKACRYIEGFLESERKMMTEKERSSYIYYQRRMLAYASCGFYEMARGEIEKLRNRPKPETYGYKENISNEKFIGLFRRPDTEDTYDEFMPFEFFNDLMVLRMESGLYHEMGKPEQAAERLKAILDRFSESPRITAEIYRRLSLPDPARCTFELHPAGYYRMLGDYYCEHLADCSKKLNCYRKALETIPEELLKKGSALEYQYERLLEEIKELEKYAETG